MLSKSVLLVYIYARPSPALLLARNEHELDSLVDSQNLSRQTD